MDDKAIAWLLEDDNPAIKYRTQTELLGQTADKTAVIKWVEGFLPANWQETKGLWYQHYVTAIAECGLRYEDIEFDKERAVNYCRDSSFECNCANFLHLRSLIMLDLENEEAVKQILETMAENQLPDGGFLCLHRVKSLKYTPKSCMKANLHALLFYGECKKRGILAEGENELIRYFFNHNIFYRTDDKTTLVLNCRKGWRTIDTFFPNELMRVGLQNVVESLCALGYGDDKRLKEAWEMLDSKQDADGKYILDGTLSKSYLPKERVGKPSKWVTFYALLAKQSILQ